MIEKAFLLDKLNKSKILSRVYTLLVVLVGWALFYITDLGSLWAFLGKMFTISGGVPATYFFKNYRISILIGILCSTPLTTKFYDKFKDKNLVMIPVLLAIFVLSVAYLVDSTYNPFIYFRF